MNQDVKEGYQNDPEERGTLRRLQDTISAQCEGLLGAGKNALLFLQLRKRKFKHPDQAIEIVKWLEENGGSNTKDYRYKLSEITAIQSLSESFEPIPGAETPIELLQLFRQFFELPVNYEYYESPVKVQYLAQVVEHYRSLPYFDRLQVVLARLNQFQGFNKLPLSDLGFKDSSQGSLAIIKFQENGVATEQDILSMALSMSESAFETFFSPDVLVRLNQLIAKTKSFLELADKGDDSGNYVFDAKFMLPLFLIAQNQEYFSFYMDQVYSVLYRSVDLNSFLRSGSNDLGKRAIALPNILKNVPELLILFQNGINTNQMIQHYWEGQALNVRGEQEFLDEVQSQLIEDILKDKDFLQKTKLIKEGGIDISFHEIWSASVKSGAIERQNENSWKLNLPPHLFAISRASLEHIERGLVIFEFLKRNNLFVSGYHLGNLGNILSSDFSMNQLVRAVEVLSLHELTSLLNEPKLTQIIREKIGGKSVSSAVSTRMETNAFASVTISNYIRLRKAGFGGQDDPLTLELIEEIRNTLSANDLIQNLLHQPNLIDPFVELGLTTRLLPHISAPALNYLNQLTRAELFDDYKEIATINLKVFLLVAKVLGENISQYGFKLDDPVSQENERKFIRQVVINYDGFEEQLGEILGLYIHQDLSQENVLALPVEVPGLLQEPFFKLIKENKKLIPLALSDQELARQLISSDYLTASRESRIHSGAALTNYYLNHSDDEKSMWLRLSDFNELLGENSSTPEDKKLNPMVFPDGKFHVDDENWSVVLQMYARLFNRGVLDDPKKPNLVQMNDYFETSDAKNYHLSQLRSEWLNYLESEDVAQLPLDIIVLLEVIEEEGAGPMKHVEALGMFMRDFRNMQMQDSDSKSKEQNKNIWTRVLEFENSKLDSWSFDERSDFYAFSSDILKAAPELYDNFLNGFFTLEGKETQEFNRNIFPLYHAYLSLMQNQSINRGVIKTEISPGDILGVQEVLGNFFDTISSEQKSKNRWKVLQDHRAQLLKLLTEKAQTRFGIIQTPEVYGDDEIRTINNILRYSATIAHPSQTKQTLLSWYFALMLNGKWQAFRRGENFDPNLFFSQEDRIEQIQEFLKKRAEVTPLTAENLNIATEKMPKFQEILQAETDIGTIGAIETVDMRLEVMVRGIAELIDQDVYIDDIDIAFVSILQAYGSSRITKTLALSFRELEQQQQFPQEDREIQNTIKDIFRTADLEWNGESINMVQNKIRSLVTVIQLHEFLEQNKIEEQIRDLQTTLIPSTEVVQLFRRIGQGFSPSSGALALSQDLDYLENQLVKHDTDFTADEKQVVRTYLSQIYSRVEALNMAYLSLNEKIKSLGKSVSDSGRPRLESRVSDLLNLGDSQAKQYVVSRLSNDLNGIIENIRACLGCLQKEVNNDTNLTFGESYRFFMYSHIPNKKGTIADQIVMLLPTERQNQVVEESQDANKEFSFVFDRLYGIKSGGVLVNHCVVVLKKYAQLKKEFPDAKLGLFMTESALTSSGMSEENFITALREAVEASNLFPSSSLQFVHEQRVITVPESPAEAHYIEFGGNMRDSGDRAVSGVSIRI